MGVLRGICLKVGVHVGMDIQLTPLNWELRLIETKFRVRCVPIRRSRLYTVQLDKWTGSGCPDTQNTSMAQVSYNILGPIIEYPPDILL